MQKKIKSTPAPLEWAKKWGPLVLAFALPFVGFVIVMMIYGCVPFGEDVAFLFSDQYHQYYPFFVAFRNALRSGDSLLYNWQIGMGLDYLGLVAYYLGSPLNLLSILVPESMMLGYFSMLVPIRLGLAGLFFAIMLKKLYGKNDISIALFGSFYALCSWALAYQWNVMWLDTFALLPLVALGTVFLLRDRKFVLYTVSLFLSIICNYYIGLFTCIFVLLLFVCYEICRFESFGRFFNDLLRIAVFSVLAIGMTAFLELPTLAALGNTQSSVNAFPTDFRLNVVSIYYDYPDVDKAWGAVKGAAMSGSDFWVRLKLWLTAMGKSFTPLLDGMRQVAGNLGVGIRHTFKEGLPNIYSGVSVLTMAFLFLTTGKVKLRDKLCSVGMLLFFILSFLLRQLDYIWHGFHFPNMIPYRFSFLFSFVLIWMAYRAWLLRHEFKVWQLITAGVLTAGILACYEDLSDTTYIVCNALCMLLTLAVFAYLIVERILSKKDENAAPGKLALRWDRYATGLLTLVMIAELVMNLVGFQLNFSTTTVADYPKGTDDTASAISYMNFKERKNSFFRAEVTHTQTFNDGALNNYNGITAFTSSANMRTTSFMAALGFAAKRTYNRYAFEESSPVANLFLNLKYMIERDGDVEENSYFSTVHNFGDVYLLENEAYLPLGFLAEKELLQWDISQGSDSFQKQSELFRLATGVEGELWQMSPNGCLQITGDNVEIIANSPDTGRITYKTTQRGTISYGYTMTKRGLFCVEINAPERNRFRLYKQIDGVKTELYSDTISLSQMASVCEVNPGDLIWLEFDCGADESATIDVQAGTLNADVFRKGYAALAASTLELTHFSNTKVEGTVSCNRDGLLYTSIPDNGFWYAEVDGEPVYVHNVGDCMVALELTKGEHTVTLRYRNKAFTTGLMVSLFCAAAFVAFLWPSPKAKGKYQTAKAPQKEPQSSNE